MRIDPFDKHQFAKQPQYFANQEKFRARLQIIEAYRQIARRESVPLDRGYWTLCNKQPNTHGSEIVQLVDSGLIEKSQFFGVDYDIKQEGIIEFNRKEHPEANWFEGEWMEVIENNFEIFNPAIIHFDYTRTVVNKTAQVYSARTMNICPSGTVFVANLMLSDGHSSKRFDPKVFVESVNHHLRHPNDWQFFPQTYLYKSSQTRMGTFVFIRS